MKQKIKLWWQGLREGSDKDFCLMALFLTLVLFVYCYFGSQSFFEKYFFGVKNAEYWKVIYHNLMAFVLFFGVGMIFSCFVCKKDPKDLYLGKGKWKLGLVLCAIGTVVCAICGLSTVLDAEMQSTYPMINFALHDWKMILLYFVSYVLYYIGWEFLFRGMALNMSKSKLGMLGAVLFSTLISALIHTSIGGFGKPMVETLSAIAAGVIFALVAKHTNSIWYGFYLHMAVGFFTDLFCFVI